MIKIYVYNEDDKKLEETITPSNFDSLKCCLYNLSDKNNGYIIYPKPLNLNDKISKKLANDFKFHCRHIHENQGNFLSNYKEM